MLLMLARLESMDRPNRYDRSLQVLVFKLLQYLIVTEMLSSIL